MTDELIVLLQAQEVGRLIRVHRQRIRFAYREEWRVSSDSYPLSLSMPLAGREYGPEVVEPFLWNLLPDNETILARWGSRFGVSARNAFELLSHVGEDLPGAVQIVLPERIDEVAGEGREQIEWLTEADVATRLRILRQDIAAWRLPEDTGQFSLAGSQPKIALVERDGRWGIPEGRTPTTHILKPPTGEWEGFAMNEHFCLRLARRLGLPAAESSVRHFEDELAIVVERYDRVRSGDRIIRVHQEDVCQCLGIHPANKYQNEGGPGVGAIVSLLRDYSTSAEADEQTFLDAVILDWLIGGTDAHAKNFSVLLGGGGQIRLAPLYDIVSRLPYDPWHPFELRLAMRIGDEYKLGRIGPRHWERLAREIKLPATQLWQRVYEIASRLPEALVETKQQLSEEAIEDPVLDRLVERATSRVRSEAKVFREALKRPAIG